MAYQKFLVDNPTCERRYHIIYDDEAKPVATTAVHCRLCGITLYQANNHSPLTMAREENLIKTSALADDLVYECNFEDKLSKATIPEYKDKDARLYPGAGDPTKVRGP